MARSPRRLPPPKPISRLGLCRFSRLILIRILILIPISTPTASWKTKSGLNFHHSRRARIRFCIWRRGRAFSTPNTAPRSPITPPRAKMSPSPAPSFCRKRKPTDRWSAGGGNGAADVYGFSVSQRALDLPRAAIKRAAEFETQAAAADLRALWQALAADVAVARLDAHLALENERLVAARERAVREQWESAKARAAAGGGTRKDELEAFARLQGIRADGFSAASDVAVAMSEISRLSGVSDPTLPPLSASFAPLPEEMIEEIVFRVDFQFAARRGGAQAAAANARIARGNQNRALSANRIFVARRMAGRAEGGDGALVGDGAVVCGGRVYGRGAPLAGAFSRRRIRVCGGPPQRAQNRRGFGGARGGGGVASRCFEIGRRREPRGAQKRARRLPRGRARFARGVGRRGGFV